MNKSVVYSLVNLLNLWLFGITISEHSLFIFAFRLKSAPNFYVSQCNWSPHVNTSRDLSLQHGPTVQTLQGTSPCNKSLRPVPSCAPTFREVAQVIGLIVSSFPGVQFGELHYRHLERNKILALQANKGDYDATMSLSKEARSELYWWVTHVTMAFKNIVQTNPDLTLTTDASNTGWRAVCEGQQTGGLWSVEEQRSHINYLEMKAVLFGLQSLCSNVTYKHIRIQSDNTTSVLH